MSVFASAIGAVAVVGAWLHYLWLIPRERVPEVPTGHRIAMVLGVAIGAIAIGLPGDWRVSLGIWTIVTAPAAAGFFYLMSIADLPDGELKVDVGDPLRDFALPDGTGALVHSEDFRGQRLLLKFFRGHW